MSKLKSQKILLGQSVIEIIIAVSMFVIIAGSAVVTILGSFLTSRLAEEETQATAYAVEGVEAVGSIRNQDWNNLASGTYGLRSSGGFWEFFGAQDDPEGSEKFERVINVYDVERDDVDDDIVESGGTVDDDTKKIVSSITWNFTPSRTNTVELTSYVTNWQEGVKPGETGTPTPTPTDTPTPTPTPGVGTCSEYCIGIGSYSAGTCRKKTSDCASNGEDYQSEGDQYCPGGAQKYCCCLP